MSIWRITARCCRVSGRCDRDCKTLGVYVTFLHDETLLFPLQRSEKYWIYFFFFKVFFFFWTWYLLAYWDLFQKIWILIFKACESGLCVVSNIQQLWKMFTLFNLSSFVEAKPGIYFQSSSQSSLIYKPHVQMYEFIKPLVEPQFIY